MTILIYNSRSICGLYYYEKNISLIEDTEFDQMCKTLLEKYDEVEHMHKPLVKKENLTAGTGYDIKYTNLIKDSAMKLQRVWRWDY